MNTVRRHPRTTVEAWPQTVQYAAAVECYRPSVLASRWVWLGGAASLAAWLLLGLVVM